jgi:hypothetical protein
MELLNWRELDFASVVVAGLVAGYVMAMGGLWAGTIPGLVPIDIADFGRRYMSSDRPSAWLLGMGSHLVNSILLVWLWAAVVEPNLSWPRPLEAALFGEVLAVALAGALMAPLSGMGFLGWKTGNPRFAITTVLLHGLWGLTVGLVYVPK